MKNEKLIQEIKEYLEPYGLWEINSIEEDTDRNLVLIKGSSELWDLVCKGLFKYNFSDLPRRIKDLVLKEHPEIREEFEESYEDLETYPELYGFPDRIEFESNGEYERLKEQFMYEEWEDYLKDYNLRVEIGEILSDGLELIAAKYGMKTTVDPRDGITDPRDDYDRIIIL